MYRRRQRQTRCLLPHSSLKIPLTPSVFLRTELILAYQPAGVTRRRAASEYVDGVGPPSDPPLSSIVYAANETRGARKTGLPAAVPTASVRPTGGLTYYYYSL